MPHNNTMTVSEVADLLRVSRQTVYNFVKQDRIPHFKVGTKVRFIRADIEALMNTSRPAKDPAPAPAPDVVVAVPMPEVETVKATAPEAQVAE